MQRLTAAFFLVFALSSPGAYSLTLDVTVTEDSADGACDTHCSLREAVITANASPGADVINVPEGVYALTLEGADEEACLTGDLDITDEVEIIGMGWTRTVVDGLGVDRVFDVHYGAGSVRLGSMTIRGGWSPEGGGVDAQQNTVLHLTEVSFVANYSSVVGGAVRAHGGSLLLADCLFAANVSGSIGGAILAEGPLEIVRTTFNGNRSVNSGGAVNKGMSGSATIDDSVFMANVGSGGGAFTIDRTDATFTNVTFTGNAAHSANGGAILMSGGALALRNCTLANDATGSGDGTEYFAYSDPEVTTENSIFSGPNRHPLCGGPFLSNGHNLATDQSCGLNAATDITGEPALRELRDNTGPTPTLALLRGSPAVDAGGGQFAAADQRGVARPFGPAPDIGAYEAEGGEPPIGLPMTVPVVAHVGGVGGTPWRSDVAVTNPGDEAIEVGLRYTPGVGAEIERQIELDAGATVLWEDIVASTFGSGNGQGILVATPPEDGPMPVVASRTFAVSGAERLGQAMPAHDPFPKGDYYIPGLREDADYRSNIGIAAGDDDLTVRVDLYRGADGAVGSTFAQTVPAGTQKQWRLPEMFPGLAQPGVPMTAKVRISGPGVPYGSLVDQVSTDAVTLIALPASPARIVPVVAHNPGLQGTFWRSDLFLHNPNPVAARVYLEYLPEDTDNRPGGQTAKPATVPAYGTVTVADVAGERFDVTDGKGVLVVVGAPEIIVTSRTYTTRSGGGTYGLGVPALPMWVRTSRPLLLTGIRATGGYRTNIGIVGGDNWQNFAVSLIAHDGSFLGRAFVSVEPRSLTQESVRDLFHWVDWGSFSVGSVLLEASQQLRAAYSSTVDGSSQDPIFVVATPVQ